VRIQDKIVFHLAVDILLPRNFLSLIELLRPRLGHLTGSLGVLQLASDVVAFRGGDPRQVRDLCGSSTFWLGEMYFILLLTSVWYFTLLLTSYNFIS